MIRRPPTSTRTHTLLPYTPRFRSAYRRHRLGDCKRWFVPADAAATEALSAAFFRLTDYPPEDRAHVPSLDLDVGGGRTLHVPKALKGVAVFSFKRLCGEARGAPDYLAVARHFHSVIIVGIPRMEIGRAHV